MKVTITRNFTLRELATLAERTTIGKKNRYAKPTQREVRKFVREWIEDGLKFQRGTVGRVADDYVEHWSRAAARTTGAEKETKQ